MGGLVKDTERGKSQENLRELFLRFYRVNEAKAVGMEELVSVSLHGGGGTVNIASRVRF